MEKINCLLGCKDVSKIKDFGQNVIYKCNECLLEFTHPMPSEKELKQFYSNYQNPRAKKKVVIKNAIENILFLKKYGLTQNSRLLDFGCGDNLFVKQGKSDNWVGYDKYCFNRIYSKKFDFITCWGVLEHLTDPLKSIKDLSLKLKESGKIVFTTVGTDTGIPYQYKIPEHVTWWNNKSIENLFTKVDIKLREIAHYKMFQDPDVYLECVLNAGKVPQDLKEKIKININNFVFVPTNEILIIGEKMKKQR